MNPEGLTSYGSLQIHQWVRVGNIPISSMAIEPRLAWML